MKTEIKNLRVQIDGLAQLTKELKPIGQIQIHVPSSTSKLPSEESYISIRKNLHKELEEATDSLYLAKAWLGGMLGEIGETTPYVNDGNRKTVSDIEPTADKSIISNQKNAEVFDNKHWSTKSHIEKVDWLREEIKKIIDTTTDFSETYPEITLEQGFVYKYLSEARFWLGFELERMRNEVQ